MNLIPVPIPLGYAYLGRWGRFWTFTAVRVLWVLVWALGARFCSDMGGCWEDWSTGALVGGGPAALVLAVNALDALLIRDWGDYEPTLRA